MGAILLILATVSSSSMPLQQLLKNNEKACKAFGSSDLIEGQESAFSIQAHEILYSLPKCFFNSCFAFW